MLNPATPDGYAGVLRKFREGLKQTGYIEGENVAFEYRWAENDVSRLPELAADLVRRRVALIAATGGPSSALAAADAESDDRASANTSCWFALRRRTNGRPITPVAPAIRILIALPSQLALRRLEGGALVH
jgi:hypothetical protein